MHKNKALLLCCIITVTAIVGLLGFGIYKDNSAHQVFTGSGYILVSPDSIYSDEINNQIYFEKGTRYKAVYPEKVVFHDQEGEKIVVDSASFVHYNDGSIGSLSKGVMVDLNNLEESIISYYGLSTESTMESAGTNYMLDNRGSSMSFQDFLWKINDSKYLLAGNNIRILFSEGNEKVFNGYIELSYYDTGIIRIVTQEGTWQTVSANCYAILENGVKLNLSNRTIVDEGSIVKLSLEQMVIGADDNIDIIPQEVKEQVIKAPEFDIETIDGTNGKVGIAGESGEAGEVGEDGIVGEEGVEGTAGEAGKAGDKGEDGLLGADGTPGDPGAPGTTGTTGVNGINGVNGNNGANGASGANGAIGEKGKSGDELAMENNMGDNGSEETRNVVLPIFEVKDIYVNTTGVKVDISVKDEENRLDPTKAFTLQIVDNNSGTQVHQAELDSSIRDFNFEYNGLLPNKEYRLKIAANYIVDNASYNRFFVNKLFVTDALGLTVEKAYAQEKALGIKVKAADYSQVIGANLQLTDAQGNAIRTSEINLMAATQAEGSIVIFDNLTPNTEYHVKVINIEMGYDLNLVAPPEIREETFWTLKRVPILGAPEVVVNKRSNSFEMILKSVSDLDGAIQRYRYEIYEVGYDGKEILVKKLYNTTNDIMPCYVDDDKVKRGYNYRMRIVAECFDNEKNTEFASALSDIVNLTGENFPIVLFEKDEAGSHHDKIKGTVKINTNGAVLTINALNPLILEYKNTIGDVLSHTITQEKDLQFFNGYYTFPFEKNDLLANDNYILSVYGTVDLKDGVGARQQSLIGSVVVKTKLPAGFTGVFSQDVNVTSPISFYLNLSDASGGMPSAYEASTMEYIEINLYNGDETAVTNSAPVATYTMVGDKGESYSSTLADEIYGNNKKMLTEADFNITAAAITSSKYTVEISSVRDYTRYGNEFTVTNHIKTFEKKATLPDLKTIDTNNGLTVIPITLANVNQYVTDENKLKEYEKFDAGIIFGYEVSAAYFDNSAQLVRGFTYYAYEESKYTTKASSQDFYTSNIPLDVVYKEVNEYGAVPRAVFLFGQDKNNDGIVEMSRGSKYIFTYRAELKQTDEAGAAVYFPEVVDPTVVIRSATANAPYQTPLFYFYPWTSSSSSVGWKYYIKAPDTAAVQGNFAIAIGAKNPTAVAPQLNTANGDLVVTSLIRGDTYTVRINTRRYNVTYNETFSNTLVRQYFDGTTTIASEDSMSLKYTMTASDAYNRYRIEVNDASEKGVLISKVVALKVEVFANKDTSSKALNTYLVPLENVTGAQGVGYLSYTDLVNHLSATRYYKITAIYDNGVSGFDSADGGLRAIQILPPSSQGNYITPNYTNTALYEDISGNAKGSYFNITGSGATNLTTGISLNYRSILIPTFSGSLNLICDQTGAKLQNLSGQPNVTLKKLEEVTLYNSASTPEVYTEHTLNSLTPTVNLNNGAALTIDTTVTSATVRWILQGHEPKMDLGEIQDNKIYMRLYKIGANSIKEDTGRIFETVVSKGQSSYTTLISGLQSNTKYGIQIYYINPKLPGENKEVYPINAYAPTVPPASNLYVFTTNETIVITPSSTAAVTYVANSYLDKYLRINYALNQTLGFDIQYSLVKKVGTEYQVMLTSKQLSDRGIIKTPVVNREAMSDERFLLNPGQVYWNEGASTVYFPFSSTDYYLCIKPVSETNPDIELGLPEYVSLNIPTLNTPFYNINTIPGNQQVTFQVSVLDIGCVMVGGHYKVKLVNSSGTDITPAAYKGITYHINTPASFTVDNIPQDDYAVLKLYTVYDLNNTGRSNEGAALVGMKDIAYADLDASGRNYLKISDTGFPLGSRGYSLGTVQIMQSSSELARIYFTNAVNLNKMKYLRYVIVNQAGVSVNYSEMFTLQNAGTNSYYYELSHRFAAKGVYQIQVRFYDETMTQMDDIAMLYYKNY